MSILSSDVITTYKNYLYYSCCIIYALSEVIRNMSIKMYRSILNTETYDIVRRQNSIACRKFLRIPYTELMLDSIVRTISNLEYENIPPQCLNYFGRMLHIVNGSFELLLSIINQMGDAAQVCVQHVTQIHEFYKAQNERITTATSENSMDQISTVIRDLSAMPSDLKHTIMSMRILTATVYTHTLKTSTPPEPLTPKALEFYVKVVNQAVIMLHDWNMHISSEKCTEEHLQDNIGNIHSGYYILAKSGAQMAAIFKSPFLRAIRELFDKLLRMREIIESRIIVRSNGKKFVGIARDNDYSEIVNIMTLYTNIVLGLCGYGMYDEYFADSFPAVSYLGALLDISASLENNRNLFANSMMVE